MKTFFSALALVAALFVAAPAAHAAVESGKPAPDFKFTDIAGKEHSIAGFKGKTVVLEWTNPGCPFVKKFYEADAMQKLQGDATANGVVWITINSSAKGKEGALSKEEAAKYVSDHVVKSTTYVVDESGEFGKLYGAKTTPHMFVINKDGVVVYQGAIDSIKSADAADIAKADNYVTAAIEAANKGEMPRVTSAAPYGCNVKYAD